MTVLTDSYILTLSDPERHSSWALLPECTRSLTLSSLLPGFVKWRPFHRKVLMAHSQGDLLIVCHLASVIFQPKISGLFQCHAASKARLTHCSIFPSNQGFTKEEKENAAALQLSSWISGRILPPAHPTYIHHPPPPPSFILMLTACLILIKTHPSLSSVWLSLNWLEMSTSSLIDLMKKFSTNFWSELFRSM